MHADISILQEEKRLQPASQEGSSNSKLLENSFADGRTIPVDSVSGTILAKSGNGSGGEQSKDFIYLMEP